MRAKIRNSKRIWEVTVVVIGVETKGGTEVVYVERVDIRDLVEIGERVILLEIEAEVVGESRPRSL